MAYARCSRAWKLARSQTRQRFAIALGRLPVREMLSSSRCGRACSLRPVALQLRAAVGSRSADRHSSIGHSTSLTASPRLPMWGQARPRSFCDPARSQAGRRASRWSGRHAPARAAHSRAQPAIRGLDEKVEIRERLMPLELSRHVAATTPPVLPCMRSGARDQQPGTVQVGRREMRTLRRSSGEHPGPIHSLSTSVRIRSFGGSTVERRSAMLTLSRTKSTGPEPVLNRRSTSGLASSKLSASRGSSPYIMIDSEQESVSVHRALATCPAWRRGAILERDGNAGMASRGTLISSARRRTSHGKQHQGPRHLSRAVRRR